MKDRQLVAFDAHTGSNSLVVSISNMLTSLFGALSGLLIVFIAGSGVRTDAFLAAYSLYLVLIMFSATLRTSLMPLFGAVKSDGDLKQRFDDVMPKVLSVGIAASILLLALSPLLGYLLTRGLGGTAHTTAGLVLAVLVPAGYLQIQSATLSAALGSARRFIFSSLAYVVTTALTVVMTAIFLLLFGVIGAAFSILIGAFLVTAVHFFYMSKFGSMVFPRFSWMRDRKEWKVPLLLIYSAAIGLALQLDLTVALSAISSSASAITDYTYAFFLMSLFIGVSAAALSLVTVPQLVSDVASRGQAAGHEYLAKMIPHAFAVLIPLLAGFAALGEPLLSAIFHSSLSGRDIAQLYDIALVMISMTVAMVILINIYVVTLATGRQQRAAVIAVTSVLLQVALVIPISKYGVLAVAAAHSFVVAVTAVFLLRATLDSAWIKTTARALIRSAPAVAISSVFLFARLVTGDDPSWYVATLSLLVAGAIYSIVVLALWPSVGSSFIGIVKSLVKE